MDFPVRIVRSTRLCSLCISALALCVYVTPAGATTLYTDLAATSPFYSTSGGYALTGSGSVVEASLVEAESFTVSGSGNYSVTQIDLSVGNVAGLTTFNASIWTDSSGTPGTQVAGASWDLSADTNDGTTLATQSSITGVALTGGQTYFMVLGPVSPTDTSFNVWEPNNQSVTGTRLVSENGGAFSSIPDEAELAFDVLDTAAGVTTPEPATAFMLVGGLMALAFLRRRIQP